MGRSPSGGPSRTWEGPTNDEIQPDPTRLVYCGKFVVNSIDSLAVCLDVPGDVMIRDQ